VVTDVPLLRSKQEEHFLSSPSSFFPLLSQKSYGYAGGIPLPSALSTRQLLPYGRWKLHLEHGRPNF
jgi:hypothetical protein